MIYKMDFEYKAPSIISKTPTTVYAFQLNNTYPIQLTYANKPDYDQLISDNNEYIKLLLTSFTSKCSKYFSKPLEVDKLLSRLSHKDYSINTLDEGSYTDTASVAPVIYEWRYTPYRLLISGTEFVIEWCIDQIETKCVIDLFEDQTDNLIEDKADIQLEDPLVQLSEINIPVAPDSTPITININSKDFDLKKVKKAQLRVELAKFKAERAYEKYIERWGYLSDDSGSDSD
jgi:hypothetical protein